MKCRSSAARCRSLMQQLHAGVERKEQYKTFAIRTNLSTKGHLPSSSNSTAQDKLPSSRVLRQSSRLAVQSPVPLPRPQLTTILQRLTYRFRDFGEMEWPSAPSECWRLNASEVSRRIENGQMFTVRSSNKGNDLRMKNRITGAPSGRPCRRCPSCHLRPSNLPIPFTRAPSLCQKTYGGIQSACKSLKSLH